MPASVPKRLCSPAAFTSVCLCAQGYGEDTSLLLHAPFSPGPQSDPAFAKWHTIALDNSFFLLEALTPFPIWSPESPGRECVPQDNLPVSHLFLLLPLQSATDHPSPSLRWEWPLIQSHPGFPASPLPPGANQTLGFLLGPWRTSCFISVRDSLKCRKILELKSKKQ